MTEVKLVCAGGTARAEVRGALTAGMTGVPVQIQCGSEWGGLIKSFVAMTASRKMAIDIVDDRAVLPWELLEEGMRLFIGLEGRGSDGTVIIPTEWASCGKVKPGAQAGHKGTPTPSEIERILDRAGDAVLLSQEAKKQAGNAETTAGEAVRKANVAFEQAKGFEELSRKTEQNAQAAVDALGKMTYVSFEINEDGELILRNPERLGTTAFRINYDTGELEVKI